MEVNILNKKIGVEPTLTPVKDFLNEKGYDVVNINYGVQEGRTDYNQFDAIVINGITQNFLGIQGTVTASVVIDASGLTPVQIENEIKKRT